MIFWYLVGVAASFAAFVIAALLEHDELRDLDWGSLFILIFVCFLSWFGFCIFVYSYIGTLFSPYSVPGKKIRKFLNSKVIK